MAATCPVPRRVLRPRERLRRVRQAGRQLQLLFRRRHLSRRRLSVRSARRTRSARCSTSAIAARIPRCMRSAASAAPSSAYRASRRRVLVQPAVQFGLHLAPVHQQPGRHRAIETGRFDGVPALDRQQQFLHPPVRPVPYRRQRRRRRRLQQHRRQQCRHALPRRRQRAPPARPAPSCSSCATASPCPPWGRTPPRCSRMAPPPARRRIRPRSARSSRPPTRIGSTITKTTSSSAVASTPAGPTSRPRRRSAS